MSSVYTCAAAVCVCLVVCSIIRLISPVGSTSKILTFIFGLFALCGMISPVAALIKDIDIKEESAAIHENPQQLTGEYNRQVLKQTSEYINEYINQMLCSSGIKINNIKTVVSESADSVIYVKQISIYIDEELNIHSKEIEKFVSGALGVMPEIITE